ncbi:hypothetical protein [Rugosimonospora acidiphila]|uniref:hypothetical protein n=1 Tax=Rugosimonospora acidiphila TaxID=556531 RepID=UPI0031ED8523
MSDEPTIIDLSERGPGGRLDARPSTRRQRYLWVAGITGLAIFAGAWIPLHGHGSRGFAPPAPTIEVIPLRGSGAAQITADSFIHQASYRYALVNAGVDAIEIDRLYVLVPGMVLLRVDPERAAISAGRTQIVTLTFQVWDCPDVLSQGDMRTLRAIVRTAGGPVEWQVELASRFPGRQWQADVAVAACQR